MTGTNEQPSLIHKQVLHVDSMKMMHHGIIVDVDSEWLYVFSTNVNAPQDVDYHFKVRRDLYPAVKFPPDKTGE